jgi:outer membrane lipoprotein-sorting protein
MKIRKIILLWTIISLSICMIAQEQKYTVKQVTEYLQHNYEAINDAVIHFEKHIKLGFAKIEQDFHGTLTMKKPNYFMVESEYEKFVTDGKTVWAYSAVNNQVIIDNYKENNNSISLE